MADRILVADDQTDIVDALRLLLKGAGFTIQAADSPSAVLAAVAGREWDCVLMDLNYTRDTTSGTEGMDLLRALREADGTLPVVTMTAWGSVEGAIWRAIHRRGVAGGAPEASPRDVLRCRTRKRVCRRRTKLCPRKTKPGQRTRRGRVRSYGQPRLIAMVRLVYRPEIAVTARTASQP